MKRFMPALLLVCLLSIPVIADGGDTSGPGKTPPPPPPPQNTTATTDGGDWLLPLIIDLLTRF